MLEWPACAPPDPHEAWVLANATHFVACAFRGRGRYERAECASLDAACAAARQLRTDHPVSIYACYHHHQACMAGETWYRTERNTIRKAPRNRGPGRA